MLGALFDSTTPERNEFYLQFEAFALVGNCILLFLP